MSQKLVWSSLAVLSAAGCQGGPSGAHSTASAAQAIVRGTPSVAADDAVVLLTMDEGLCTGTLVAPNLVLTARHCVAEIDENSECGTFGADMPADSIGVSLGVHAEPEDQGAVVARGKQLFHESSDDGCTTDLALILLDRDVPDAKLAAIRLTPTAVGESARTLGYGEDGERGGDLTDGRYERAELTIDSVGPDSYVYETENQRSLPVDLVQGEILTGESTCFGDSGGPLLDQDGAVVGVTSRGIDGNCIDRPSIYSATATHAGIIQVAFAAAGFVPGGADAGADAAPPDAGASSSSSSGRSADDGDDTDDTSDESSSGASTTHAASQADGEPGGCSAGARTGSRGAGALWLLAGLALVRRRKLAS